MLVSCLYASRVIPTALRSDRCPIASSDGGDAGRFGDERVPGVAAGVDDGVVCVVDAVAEVVLA